MTPMDALLDTVQWERCPAPAEPTEQPYPTHHGWLTVGRYQLECYILNTGKRIFTKESVELFFSSLLQEHLEKERTR